MPQSEYVTVPEFAQMRGDSVRKTRMSVERGDVASERAGGHGIFLIRRTDAVEFARRLHEERKAALAAAEAATAERVDEVAVAR